VPLCRCPLIFSLFRPLVPAVIPLLSTPTETRKNRYNSEPCEDAWRSNAQPEQQKHVIGLTVSGISRTDEPTNHREYR
jgi:hypothetical protein